MNKVIPIQTQQPRSQLVFENRWASGVCGCCSDCNSCCYAFWCYPCFLCSMDSAARECTCTTCCLCMACGMNAGVALTRAKLRGVYKIYGTLLEDFCLAFCCPCCTALQIYRELKFRGEINDDKNNGDKS